MKHLPLLIAGIIFCSAKFAYSANQEALNALLEETRNVRLTEQQEHQKREQAFLNQRSDRARLLAQAKAVLAEQKSIGASLSETFDTNESALTELQEELDKKVGTLGEMFGVVRQVAGDSAALMRDSMISAQHPKREAFLQQLSQSKALPSIEQLERLWFEMQREMTASGAVVSFSANVVSPDGAASSRDVVRVGPFTAVADGEYLSYLPGSQQFAVLARQPPGRYRAVAETLQEASQGYVAAVIDPTRGSLLSVLVQRPGLDETISYGGVVGYVIIFLAAIGLLLGLFRLARLTAVSAAVIRQKKQIDKPFDTNPLGRVLKVYHEYPDADNETLQLHLNEAILREVPRLETGLGALKILAAVGPLLGLLGTVTGMIITFQQITLFGTGDPKLMAGGISQALVTTVMGLVMAIPLLLLHGFLNSRSQDLVQVLEEETAGIIAEQAQRGMTPKVR